MTSYRTFLNGDPPRLLQLALNAGLGRGMARPRSIHGLDLTCFALPYFDPRGLIVAVENSKIVGFVHAGFGFTADGSQLDKTQGVICALVVSPAHRKQGIGSELLKRAERYLIEQGCERLQAGQSRNADPFYFGIYGGARSSGFLASDPATAPFFAASGYLPAEQTTVMQCDLEQARREVDFRVIDLKRRTELVVMDRPDRPNLWWYTHFGNIESMQFRLVDRRTGTPTANLTVVGLDHYIAAWHDHVIGLVNLWVEEQFRGQGYGQLLISEALRRLKNDLISTAEIHIPNEHPETIQAMQAAGFTQVDLGTVYRKPSVN